MKRVKAACIMQTLVFSQKPELGYTPDQALKYNREEYRKYVELLEHTRTRYVIVDETEFSDGSLQVHVKKQYNETSDVSEYF